LWPMVVSLSELDPELNKCLLSPPGLVNMAETQRQAISKQDICHRKPYFSDFLPNIEQELLSLFQVRIRRRNRAVVMHWIFAASQMLSGTSRSWQRGRNIDANHKRAIQK
jgi:hypothetical protein